MVAANLVVMFSDTLLSCFSHLFTSLSLLFAQLCLSHAFVLFVMGLWVAWVHVWRFSFFFYCSRVPQTGFAALNEAGEKFPSIQTMDINSLVYGILSVKFAFFVKIDDFPPTTELFAAICWSLWLCLKCFWCLWSALNLWFLCQWTSWWDVLIF